MKTLPNCSAWSAKNLRLLDSEAAIPRNWEEQWRYARTNPSYMGFCRQIVATGGPILEVAAGPGGGNVSPLLHIDPTLDIILNDIEPGITERWRGFLDNLLPEHRLSFGAFDICHIPLPDATLACVSSSGGFGTMLGSHEEALRECARVLRPGGLLFAHEMTFTEQCLDDMPAALRDALVPHPWLFRRWHDLLRSAGFEVVTLGGHDRRTLSPDDSPLARDAALFDYVIEMERTLLSARRGRE